MDDYISIASIELYDLFKVFFVFVYAIILTAIFNNYSD